MTPVNVKIDEVCQFNDMVVNLCPASIVKIKFGLKSCRYNKPSLELCLANEIGEPIVIIEMVGVAGINITDLYGELFQIASLSLVDRRLRV